MTKKTLVVAPHPDDEVLGCGGTLLRRKMEGGTIGWLIVTGMTLDGDWPAERILQRDKEIEKVSSLMGFDQVFKLGFPTTGLDSLPMSDVVAAFSSVFRSFEPEEVLVPHGADVHSDHRVTFDAVAACAKWFRYPSVRRVLAFETISETEFGLGCHRAFTPNYFVDISEYLERKLEILKVYQTELGEFPFPRSLRAIQALAEWRGASAGFLAAEAFEVLRERE
jgi:LmbE family N-acetylglucosaminyl deacetylase